MPEAQIVYPYIEGMLGIVPDATDLWTQGVPLWGRLAKLVMVSTPALRNATDWNFVGQNDVDQTGDQIGTSVTGTFWGAVLGTNNAAEADFWAITDATSNTFDGTAALDNTDDLVWQIPVVAATANEEFHCILIPTGHNLDTGLTVAADGVDGADPAADQNRAWILYRG